MKRIWQRSLLPLGALIIALMALVFLIGTLSAELAGTVNGIVLDAEGPVAGATVRMRATDNYTMTSAGGHFTLGSLPEEKIEITAWADGYYVASRHVTPTVGDIILTLRPYHTIDHPEYQWISPISGTSEGACGKCHPMIVTQWSDNAHGTAVSNARFFSLYNGVNLSGTLEVGPGYLQDFGDTAGTCANCHAPGAGIDGYLTTNMNDVRDEVTAGIHCDYCHKVGGVYLNPATHSVYPNAPGAQSQRMLRPPAGDNIFFGPYDDIHDPDTYLPAISESAYCAPCHQFSFWGTPVYESYEEWLGTSYATAGVTCQKCHMPPDGEMTFFARPEVGGLEHPPETIPSHLQLGAGHIDLLQNTVDMSLSVQQEKGRLEVAVTITNSGAGHHVPTDYPGRQMILVVTAEDADGRQLIFLDGPTIPAWGDQAGLPGAAFAKVLRDAATGEAPVISYWKQTFIAGDNRLPALTSHRSSYLFEDLSSNDPVQVTARLIFRRLFQEIADQKGWDMPDIVMEERNWPLPSGDVYLPFVVASGPSDRLSGLSTRIIDN